jgi:TP901 family phage tail tape measure protein
MAREFSVVVGINATKAIAGGRQFKAGADQVNRSNRLMQASTARTTKRMTAMITTMGRVRGVASLMFAGFLGVGGIGAVIRTLTQFTGALSKVEALLGDRGVGGAMAALEGRARQLGATTVFTATQAAEGMQFLTLAGFDALEVFHAIGPALQLAQAGALGLGQAADIVSNIMAGFGVEASKTVEVVDALAFVASRTNTNIQQLGEAMKFVAPVAGAIGISVEETAAALGILGNAGLQASLAGTSLRRVFSGLLNPSKEATQVLGSMNLVAQDLVDKIGKPGGLNEVIHILAKRGLGAAEAFTLFGQRGAPGILSLIRQKDKLGDMNIAMADIAGTAETMAQVMTDNLGGDARLAISALQEGILQLGEAGLTQWLRETTQGFGGFIRGITGVKVNMVTASEAMKDGIKSGEKFKENIVAIKRALVILTTFMLRRTIIAIGAYIAQMVIATAATLGYSRSMIQLGVTMGVVRTSLLAMRAALIATGIGAAVVLVGYLASLLLVQDDLKESNVETAMSYDDLSDKVGVAAFNFDKLSQAERELQVEHVQLKRLQDELDFADLTKQIKLTEQATLDEAAAVQRLADAKKALRDRGLENLSANDAAASASKEIILLMNERTLATSALGVIERQLAGGSTLELRAEQGRLTREIELGTERLAIYDLMQKDNSLTLSEATKIIKENTDARKEAIAQLLRETGLTVTELSTLDALIKKYDKMNNKQVTLADGYALVAKALAHLVTTGEGATEGAEAYRRALLAMSKAMEKDAVKAAEELAKAIKKAMETTEDLKDEVAELTEKYPGLSKLQRQFGRDVAFANLELQAGALTLEEYIERVKLLGQIFEANANDLCERNKEVRKCTEDSVGRMTEIWKQGMRNIQDAWADAFRDMLDGGGNFFDGILDAFKDMIANMIAAWVGSGLLNLFSGNGFTANGNGFGQIFSQGVGSMMGGSAGGGATGTGSGGVSGTGVLGGIFQEGGSLEGIGTAMSDALVYLKAIAGQFIHGAATLVGLGSGTINSTVVAGTGIGGVGASTQSVVQAGGTAANIGGSMFASAGIGIISGAIADALLGSRGSPMRLMFFTAIGGIIGGYYGGFIGAVIGGAIGGLVDNIFGGAEKLESATVALSIAGTEFTAAQTEVVSTQRSWFRGRKFETTEKNVSYKFNAFERQFVAFAEALDMTAEAFGGSSEGFLNDFAASMTLDVKNMSSDQLSAALTSFMNKVLLDAIQMWLDEVEGIESHVHTVLSSFSGNLEEFSRAVGALLSIGALFDINLIEAASEAIVEANVGVLESYTRTAAGYRQVIETYDGSIESLEALVDATALFTAVQIELISVYQRIGDEISGMFQTSAQTVREALLSEEELYDLRRSQIDDLVAQAALTTDPEELSRLANEINRLGLDAFGMLDQSQIDALGPEFIEFFENLDALFGDQITTGISDVVQEQADLDLEVATRLEEAAQAIIDAAAAQERFYRDERDRRRDRHRDELQP